MTNDTEDVRMRGFSRRTLVSVACRWIDEHCAPQLHEAIPLVSAPGRVLAEDVVSDLDVPPFARSAMDGYAVIAAETNGATSYNPIVFNLVGTSLPGEPFDGEISAGDAVRIMTGAPIPTGADAVVPAEFASEGQNRVELSQPIAPGKNVGRVGEDIESGTVILSAGRRLRPQDIGLMASVGQSTVRVVRAPRVRVVITGSELIEPGEERNEHQIFDANSFILQGLLERDGGSLESLVRTLDSRETIEKAMTGTGADVVLVSGGSSVGAEDFAPRILAEHGELAIHGIAVRPASPTGMGILGGRLVFLLPGNPVSCLCAYDMFAGRAIRQMAGRSAEWTYPKRRLTTASKIVSAIGRVDYCRVRLLENQVEPIAVSGASILSSTTRADGFVVIPESCEGYAPGTEIDVYLYDFSE